jgi:hypothetical protein
VCLKEVEAKVDAEWIHAPVGMVWNNGNLTACERLLTAGGSLANFLFILYDALFHRLLMDRLSLRVKRACKQSPTSMDGESSMLSTKLGCIHQMCTVKIRLRGQA